MKTCTYPSDLSDEEWAILKPLITPATQAGHPQALPLRRIVDAVFHLLRAACRWRALPHDFPPWTAVFYHLRQVAPARHLGADQRRPARAAPPRRHRPPGAA